MTTSEPARLRFGRQFSLMSLFELTTICSLIAAGFAALEVRAALSLMYLAAALQFGSGELGLLGLIAVCLFAFSSATHTSDTMIFQQAAAVFYATAICVWYWLRRIVSDARAIKNPGQIDRGLLS